MLESTADKATDEKLSVPCNNAEHSSETQLTVDNKIEVFKKKKQKENYSDGMKLHNFTECCRMWMCSHCSKSFASSRALKIHEVKQHENATRHVLKCGTCHEEFEHSNLLHIHMRVHHNVKVRCPRCKDIFEHPSGLKLHIKAHHSEPVCIACGLKFDHDKLLRLHMEHYHKIGGKGAKQGATTPSGQFGRKPKAFAERKASEDVKSPAEEQKSLDNDNHEDVRQMKPGESLEQVNSCLSGEWEFGCNQKHDYDEEVMSRDSSDSRDEGSSDGEVDDLEADKESDGEAGEAEDVVERQIHKYSNSPPRENVETVRSSSKKESDSNDGVVERMERGPSPPAVERHNVPVQPQRSSVIVTTGSFSPPVLYPTPRETFKRKAEDSEEATKESGNVSIIVTEVSPSWDVSPKKSPHSPQRSYTGSPAGSYPESPTSALSEDESGDSESASHKAHTARRVTLRCNRCQEEFKSKMEYLHHLISHQKGDENLTQIDDMSPEKDAIQKLKSSLRIKMGARQRESFADDVDRAFDIRKKTNHKTEGAFADDQTSLEASRTSPPSSIEDPSSSLPVSCSLCSKRFPDMRELKAHVDSCHKKPQCTECGLQFDHKNLFTIHMNSYHSSLEMLQCYHCGESFGNRSEFVAHVTSHETTMENTKETRKGHKPLRRISSAPLARENHQSQIRSDRKIFLESERNSNCSSFGDINEMEKRGKDDHPLPCSDNLKNRFDALRGYGERQFTSFGMFRHHKEETVSSQEQDNRFSKGKSNVFVGPEARTRIFLPKYHEKIEAERELVSGQRRVPEELTAVSSAGNEMSHEATAKRLTPSSEGLKHRLSAFSAYERADGSNELAKHMLLARAKRERDGVPLCRPPPLIPVVHPRLSAAYTRQSGPAVLRAHRPVTRTASANSALKYSRVLPYPTLSTKWPLEFDQAVPQSPVRDSPRDFARDAQEFSNRESINSVTKEALLNSLSLRRRASAPELGTMPRPLAEPRRLAVPESPTVKNALGGSPQRSDNIESPLAASPGPSRQLKDGYHPRRRHPRDFTCHHCGIYFGHKKLLKIHLDCYHGSAQELQCLRCEKNFSCRSEFLEHLMSHEGGDELLAFQRKRLRLDRRSSLPHEGETVIRRELNTNVVKETVVKTEKNLQQKLELADLRTGFGHPIPVESKQRVDIKPREYPKPNSADLKRKSGVTTVKVTSENNEDDDGANFCFVCGQSFSNGKKLEHHISSHAVVDKNGRYCCSLCHKTFDHHRKLEIHTRSHTGFKPHKCELCGRCFPYYSSYYYHKMTHTEDRPHKCGVCGKGFIQTRYLRSHMKTHKEHNGWASDEELNVEGSPEQAKSGNDAEIPYSDTEKNTKSEPVGQVDSLVQRDLEEHDTARILCSFKQSSTVVVHEQSSSRDNQADHVMSEDPPCVEGSPSTNRMGEPNRSSLEACPGDDAKGTEHSRVTETATSGKVVPDESLPKTKKKKYKCKHCEKNFSSYSSLHVHVRIHTGQRPYSCNHCFKKFTHSSGLKRHVRCHTGEKPYPCPACPSAFADRGALKSHIRTHTGERPFVCDLCNKTFTQPSSLRVHKKTVHAHEFFDDK